MRAINGILVFQSRNIPLTRTNEDGSIEAVFFVKVEVPRYDPFNAYALFSRTPPCRMETRILVHPERWDAFWLAVNQPDVYFHPELQEFLQSKPSPS